MTNAIRIEIAPGELLDKQSILEIKAERIVDSAKRANVMTELEVLRAARRENVIETQELDALYRRLKAVNERLWDIEDAIRDEERSSSFSVRFIELARSVYRDNDERAAIKREINLSLGSRIVEEKSYAPYE